MTPEEVTRAFLSSNGPRLEDFAQACRRWLAPDVVWYDRGNPDGVHGHAGLIAELERARTVGVEYMSFEILDLATVGNAVLTRRFDRLHAADGAILANLDVMGYNLVEGDLITYGKDYHFDIADYDQNWVGQTV